MYNTEKIKLWKEYRYFESGILVFLDLCINFLGYHLELKKRHWGYARESYGIMIYISKRHLIWLSVFLISDHSTKNKHKNNIDLYLKQK